MLSGSVDQLDICNMGSCGVGLAIERFIEIHLQHNCHNDIGKPTSPSRVARWVKRLMLFHFVCFTWVFFRADSCSDAIRFLSGIKTFSWRSEYFAAAKFLALFTIPLFLLDLVLEKTGDEYPGQSYFVLYRFAIAGALLIITVFLSANHANAFIYFQFWRKTL
jgi:hypothetical protein